MNSRAMKMVMQLSAVGTVAVLMTACATTVKPSYVSPTQSQALNCVQLGAEFNRIQQYINTAQEDMQRIQQAAEKAAREYKSELNNGL